jgi:hypothetical protein
MEKLLAFVRKWRPVARRQLTKWIIMKNSQL